MNTLLIAGALFVLGALSACSSGTTSGGVADAGGSSGSSGSSGRTGFDPTETCATKAGVGCNTLAFGEVVHPTCGEAPAPAGGTIAEGSYVLTAGPETCDTIGTGLSDGTSWSYSATGTTLTLISTSTVSTYTLVP